MFDCKTGRQIFGEIFVLWECEGDPFKKANDGTAIWDVAPIWGVGIWGRCWLEVFPVGNEVMALQGSKVRRPMLKVWGLVCFAGARLPLCLSPSTGT